MRLKTLVVSSLLFSYSIQSLAGLCDREKRSYDQANEMRKQAEIVGGAFTIGATIATIGACGFGGVIFGCATAYSVSEWDKVIERRKKDLDDCIALENRFAREEKRWADEMQKTRDHWANEQVKNDQGYIAKVNEVKSKYEIKINNIKHDFIIEGFDIRYLDTIREMEKVQKQYEDEYSKEVETLRSAYHKRNDEIADLLKTQINCLIHWSQRNC